MISFVVPGEPQGKGRARATKTGRMYTPTKTKAYETQVAWLARDAMGVMPAYGGPLRLRIEAVHGVPPSWPKKRREAAIAGETAHTSRPDISNIVKAIEDGMNGVVYRDDSQIVLLVARKRYGENPRVEVEVSEL